MVRYVLVIVLSVITLVDASGYRIASPDDRIVVDIVTQGADSVLMWETKVDGRSVSASAPLGIMVDGLDLSRDMTLRLLSVNDVADTYELVSHSGRIETACKEMVLEAISATSDRSMRVEVRCYDGGVAYRLRVPGTGRCHVDNEIAEFRLPIDSKVWFGERNSAWKLKTYAGDFTHSRIADLYKVSQQGPVQLMPLLCQPSDSLYVMIAEAGLLNYSGMRLRAMQSGALVADFTESDGFDIDGEILTPWRVLIIERDLTGLINSHLVQDLAPKPDNHLFADRSWIKPGRSVWSWWSNIDGRFMDEDAEREVIDIADKLGFEYTTLDEGWEDHTDKWTFVKSLVEYGASKGVGVFLWRHSNRLNDPACDYRDMALFMDSVAAIGVKGLKIDFMNGESKAIIDFTTKALQLAAERKLLVNFHGCQKPSGEIRTYPNELTREAVRGLELNRITADYRRRMTDQGKSVDDSPYVVGNENQCISAGHNVLLPLTRGVLGSMDYTPIGFSMPGNTTWAHQLATAYLMQSSLLTMAENPFYLLREPKLCGILPFIASLPVVWDQTIVLPATELGESLVMARRSGSDWYLAGISVNGYTGGIVLDFLDSGHEYHGTWIADRPDSDAVVECGQGIFHKEGVYECGMRPHGGFVLRLQK